MYPCFHHKRKSPKKDLLDSKQTACSSKLRKELDKIKELLDRDQPPWVSLQLARDNIDKIKEEFNDAHHEFHEFLDSEEQRESSYPWFDLQDRVFMEMRTKLVDKIYSEEKKIEKPKPKSVLSGETRSRSSKISNTSGLSARSRRIEAAARKAKLEVERQFLDQEREIRKLQLLKEISVAEAEENAMKRILNEDNDLETDGHADKETQIGHVKVIDSKDKTSGDNDELKLTDDQNQKSPINTVEEDNHKDNKNDVKFTYQENGKQIKMSPYSPPFIPKLDPSQMEPSYSAEVKPNIKVENGQNQESSSLNESAIKELIKLQEKQTELSAAIAKQ